MRGKRRRTAIETIGVSAAVVALVAAPLVGTTTSSASAAAPRVVVSADFDDSTLGDLQQSGSPTLAYVDEGDGKALRVTGRGETWHTVQSAPGVLEPGVEYTFSARIKLVDADPDAQGRFTVADGAWTPVGAQALSTAAWTTVRGTYTLPAGVADPAAVQFSLEAGTWAGSTPGFLLDDVLVTRPAPAAPPAGPTTVVAADFDDATLGDLRQSGEPTLGYVTEGDGKALSVTGRGQTWHTVESAAGVLDAGVEYTLSARIRLLDEDAAAVGRFTVHDGAWTPVGAQALSTTAWTTVTGTYTLPAGADPATVKVAVEAGSWDGSRPSFLVDDVLVTRPAAATPPVDPVAPVVNPPAAPNAAGTAQGTGQDAAGTAVALPGNERRDATTNYELDRTITHLQHAVGSVSRLSVAVIVNHLPDADGNPQPLPAEQLEQLRNLVREAIGFSAERGDSLSLMNSAFASPVEVELPWWQNPMYVDLAKTVGGWLLFLLIAVWLWLGVGRPLLRRHVAGDSIGATSPAAAQGEATPEVEADESAAAAARARQQSRYEENLQTARELAAKDPRAVAAVLRTWIEKDEQ